MFVRIFCYVISLSHKLSSTPGLSSALAKIVRYWLFEKLVSVCNIVSGFVEQRKILWVIRNYEILLVLCVTINVFILIQEDSCKFWYWL
jgi:hypothetical protein